MYKRKFKKLSRMILTVFLFIIIGVNQVFGCTIFVKANKDLILAGNNEDYFEKEESYDDLETFEFFRDLLRHYRYHRKNILIISPNPEMIGSAIEEAACLLNVCSMPFYWNYLWQWPAFSRALNFFKFVAYF